MTAVRYYMKCQNQVETCRIFECSERSLMRWVDRFEDEGTVERRPRPSIANKVEQRHVNFILKRVKQRPAITMKDLHVEVLERFRDLDISRVHVGNIVRDNNVTLKRSRVRHEPTHRYGKEININSELDRFYRSVKRVALDDIVCIDETSLQAFMVRKYCRSPIGKRCTIKTHSQEVFKKYTGIFAITTRGCVAYEIYESGGITAQRLLDFLRQRFAHHRNKLFVMDNASSHRNPEVRRYIERNNSLLYSVPYQHYTNAIENFFSVMKSHIQKEELVGRAALLRSIPKALDAISRQQYHNFFSGAYEREGAEKYERGISTRRRTPKNYL